jgi:Tol biopolymer transport system component
MAWLDRSGKPLGKLGDPGFYAFPVLSPDGHALSISREDTGDRNKSDVWLMDVQRGTLSRLTFAPAVQTSTAWSADSAKLVVASVTGKTQIFPIRSGGTPETISGDTFFRVNDWTNDGRTLVVSMQNSGTGWDVLTISATGGPAKPLLNTTFNEGAARLSPDNRWLAYSSNESGKTEVYVIPFPGPGGRWQISNNGANPLSGSIWSKDGKELYYQDAAGNLMAAAIDGKTAEFHPSLPRQLFSAVGGVTPVAAMSDGRILVMVQADDQSSPPMTIVVNWDAELNK